MARFVCGLLFALCVVSPAFCAPAAGKKDSKVSKSSEGVGLAKKYKVVTVPDGLFVIQNKTGSKTTFEGPYVYLLDAFAEAGNFTYEITAQADGNFGKKQADGKFNGMIGDVVDGKYDLILTNIAFTKDIAAVLAGAVLKLNASEWALVNPKKKSSKPDYVVRKNLDYFLLKNSEEATAKAVWANIKGRMPASIVANTDEGVKQATAGKYFLADEDTIDDLVAQSKGALEKDATAIYTNVPVYPFATKKGSELGIFLNTLLALVSDDKDISNEFADEIMGLLTSAFNPGDSSK